MLTRWVKHLRSEGSRSHWADGLGIKYTISIFSKVQTKTNIDKPWHENYRYCNFKFANLQKPHTGSYLITKGTNMAHLLLLVCFPLLLHYDHQEFFALLLELRHLNFRFLQLHRHHFHLAGKKVTATQVGST